MAKKSPNWYKHGRHAMSVHYTSNDDRYYRLEKSFINRKKRVSRY